MHHYSLFFLILPILIFAGLKYHTLHTHTLAEREVAEQVLKAIRDDPAERPYVCKVTGCGKRYKNANGLKYHMLHHHNGSHTPSASGSLN
jgi:hypothetical protein